MPGKKTLFLSFLVGVMALVFLLSTRQEKAPLDQFFKLTDGRSVSLSDTLGKPVLLNFWSTTCAICIEEMPDLVNLYDHYHPLGFELISVTMPYDRPDVVLEISRNYALPFPVALDIFGEVGMAFGGVNATPTHILINAKGEISDKFIGRIDPAKLTAFLDSELSLTE